MNDPRRPRHSANRAASSRSADRRTDRRAGGSLLDSMDEARANARVRDTRNRPPAQRFRQEESRSDARGRWLKGAVLVLAVAAVAAILLVAMRTCAPDIGGAPEGSEGEAAAETAKVASTGYASPYNWENLVRDGTRWSYMVDGQELSRTGIDVSESQQWIDWQAVAADDIDFAIIRAGYRNQYRIRSKNAGGNKIDRIT